MLTKVCRKCVKIQDWHQRGAPRERAASAIDGRRLFVTPVEHRCLLYIYVHADTDFLASVTAIKQSFSTG